jgi:hypothetical protein
MPYSYECDQDGENCEYVWYDDDSSPSFHIDNAIDSPDQYPDSDDTYIDPYDSGQDPSAGGDINQDYADIGFMGDVGNLNITEKDGKYFQNGTLVYDPKDANGGILGTLNKLVDKTTFDKLKKLFVNDKDEINLAGLASVAGGIYSLMGGNTPKTGGYKGTVPKYEAVRRAITQPEYTPYSGEPAMGRRYFSDVAYVPKTDTAGIAAAEETAANQIADLEKYVPRIAAPKSVAKQEPMAMPAVMTPEQLIAQERGIVADKNVPAVDVMGEIGRLNPASFVGPVDQPVNNSPMLVSEGPPPNLRLKGTDMASGGIAMLAKGRYLRGQTDGMADKIPSSIDNKQPAKLSHGEFVIPADVVSHLGNGNSDAGADVLYKMMDRVRKARTGNKKQGKRINPAKFTPGGIAGYAGGGAVAFQTGGAASTGVTGNATTETSLAPWAGDAVTDYIGRGTALAKEAFIPYQGALSAGTSPLQQQAFEKAGGLGGTFDSAAASQYMNPYIQNALQPQLNELRRQADISQQALSGKFAGAGALGGARDTIARSEGIRNLLNQQSGVIGGAYKDAYDKAMQQYNTSRTQELNDLNAMLGAGQTQRGIEEDKIKADRAAFEEERLDPYQKIKFEQSLFSGLPLSSTTTTPNLSPLQQIGAAGKDITQLYDMINKWLKTG